MLITAISSYASHFSHKRNVKFEVGNETRAYVEAIHSHSFQNGSVARGCRNKCH